MHTRSYRPQTATAVAVSAKIGGHALGWAHTAPRAANAAQYMLDPRTLARELHAALAADSSKRARLLVLGAEDDPMLRELATLTRDLPEVYTHVLQHGGHAAMLLIQPAITRAVLQRFFAPDGRASF